jgi:serine/threonine protein kinase
MSASSIQGRPEYTEKRRERADSGTFTCEDEGDTFCENMLHLADYLIEEDPMVAQPDQLTLRYFKRVYQIPDSTTHVITKLLDRTQLITSLSDPADAPGLAHCIQLLSNNKPEKWAKDRAKNERMIENILLGRENRAHNGNAFDVGKVVGGRWSITSELKGVDGTYNQGIRLVRDDVNGEIRIMKILPSEAMYPGYQIREMNILSRVIHRNIITLYGVHLPSPVTERHASPYLVTEYCDKGTLASLIKTWNDRGELIPESFVWQVFEALVTAVQYLHHGPYPYNAAAYNWDPITHRDIIPSNIFLKSSPQVDPGDYPISIKLADFGCAITDSEMAAQNYSVRDLPAVSGLYRPPEGAQATEATDMYQVGLVISLMYCMMDSPSDDVAEAVSLTRDHLKGYKGCSPELRMYIEMCLDDDEDQRPDSNFFVLRIQSARRFLSNVGKLGEQVELFVQD